MSVSTASSITSHAISPDLPRMNPYFNTTFYRATREIQHNTILNRSVIEILGADLPTTLTELIGRNWKTAVEVAFRISLYLVNSFFIPILFMPILNKISAKKHGLPGDFQKKFYIPYEDLLPENNTLEKNQEFKQKLTDLEGKEKVEAFLGTDETKHNEKISDYKKTMLSAKSHVMKLDLFCDGLLTYVTPWIQNIFSKKILGVVGYTGEDDLLSESQKEESAEFHEKTKYFKFLFGGLITILGGNWYSNKVRNVASMSENEAKNSKVSTFIRKNIKQFDYYKEIYSNKLNLAGTFLFGGDLGYLLTCRSLNELLERCLRLVVFWPTMFFGVEWANYKLCENHDKKHGSKLVDYDIPKELGIRQVKSLEKLEEELLQAKEGNNEEKIKIAEQSIKTQVKNYWYSILLDSLIMGVGLTSANIIGTKMRVQRGIY